MSEDALGQQIWQALDERRKRGGVIDVDTVAEVLEGLPSRAPAATVAATVARLGHGELMVPAEVTDFVTRFATRRTLGSVVDPCCGLGQLAAQISAAAPTARVRGVTRSGHVHRVLTRIDARVEWQVGDAAVEPHLLGTLNDLVVSFPPFGLRVTKEEAGETGGRELAEVLVMLATQTLAPDGEALFVLTPRCWRNATDGGWRRKVTDAGFAVGAAFFIPSGTFAPFTGIPAVLVQVVRGEQRDVFIGELPSGAQQAELLLNNFKHRRSARDARLGRWVALESATSLTALIASERVEELGRKAGSRLRLGDIANIQNWKPKDDVAADAVMIPMEGSASRQAVLAGSGEDLKGRHVSIVVYEGLAVPGFLAHYFNTELGRLARETAMSGMTVSRVSKDALADAPVYLPDVQTQRQALGTSTKLQTLISELRELDEKLWSAPKRHDEVDAMLAKVNREDRFELWLDTLPFPLATILWVYVTETTARGKVDTLLHFFEAYAQFWATTLLSLFLRTPSSKTEWSARVHQVLRDQKQSVELSTFGTWLTIVELLSKAGRDRRAAGKDGEDSLRRQAALVDDRFLDVLLSKELLQTLRATNTIRNAWTGHNGIVSEDVAETQLAVLNTHLGNLRVVVGEKWNLYVLCRGGKFEMHDGVCVAQMERVMGTRAPFAVDEVELATPVNSGRLHLVGPGARDALPLLPFVRVMASPKTALNACYFYNRSTKAGVRFVSYHYREDSDVTDRFDDTALAVAALSMPPDPMGLP